MEIEFKNVVTSKNLPKLNFSISRNEITVLSGDKTKEIIPNLLMGFDSVMAGEIIYLNKKITKETFDFKYIQFETGYVFLNPSDFLTNKMVKQEILFGLNFYNFNKINERMNYYLNVVGLDNSYLNKKSLELDLNNQKKVMLASVLAIEPKVLLLNCIEHGLNKKEQKDLKKLLLKIKKENNITIIIISNNTNFYFDIVDRVIVFKENKIILDGDSSVFYEKGTDKYLDIPPIIDFISMSNSKKIKLAKTNDINELMKDIYRKANEKC